MTRGGQKTKEDIAQARAEATRFFEEAIGVYGIPSRLERIGNRTFLKFVVGRRASAYDHALRTAQVALPGDHPFKGLMSLEYKRPPQFPESLEADVLLSMLTRSTRHVVQEHAAEGIDVSYVPFQNKEDDKVIQPASHLIVGRRGVGKSTLINRAIQLLKKSSHICVVLDMQAYASSTEDTIFFDALGDITQRIADGAAERTALTGKPLPAQELEDLAKQLYDEQVDIGRMGPRLRRIIARLTKAAGGDVFVFLDDFHVVDAEIQPRLLHVMHGALTGAGGWLKVAGLRSLLHFYDPSTRRGIQSPGDAQLVSLDLTLVDPRSAEDHLEAIVTKFLEVVGVDSTKSIIPDAALRRLVWANAGVPRDFLEMIGRSLEHARRSKRSKITLTDANLAIGEFGQRKIDDMEKDARNEEKRLRKVVDYLEKFCLEEKKVNAFLVRSENSSERETIQVLSDLRIVHLIHPTITPHKAGERYEAFLVDYCLFTGFRRRPNIKEMLPEDGQQFKATELRKIPTLPRNFLREIAPKDED